MTAVKTTKEIQPMVEEQISQQTLPQTQGAPSESAQNTRVFSSEDSLIADLVKEQPNKEQVDQMKITTQRVPDMLAFPEECLPLQGKYRFAWLTKGKDLSTKLRTNGWVLCNRSNSPFIKDHRFGAHGAVEQGGMLLVYLPEKVRAAQEMVGIRQSQDRVKHYTKGIFENQDKDAGASFYKPEDDDKD